MRTAYRGTTGTEDQLRAGSDAAAKATLKIKTIGEAPQVVGGMELRPTAHAAHAAHVVRHATAELKHDRPTLTLTLPWP